MRFFHLLVFTALILLLLPNCNNSLQAGEAPKKAKNIILLIGDGMGLAQLSTAFYFSDQPSNFARFKYIGLHQNTPVGAKITDSASGATAFSTGYKSYNAAIGVDGDTIARETILEWAAKKKKSTGVIATSSITHATPASFYAHVASRHYYEAIAAEFVDSPVDFAAGGGYQFFNQRQDGRDLLEELKQKGFEVNTEKLEKKLQFGTKYAFLLRPDSLNSIQGDSIQGSRGDFLPRATRLALDYLSKDEDGFFLMVEGSQIDWGGHGNKANFIIEEVKDFDQAVGAALDFAKKDKNTLVVVTADHETGGLALSAPEIFGQRDYRGIKPTFSTGGHTASLIPVLAYGPGAEDFIGIYQNNAIFQKMKSNFSK